MKLHLIIILILFITSISAQDTTSSLAFKKNRPVEKYPVFYRPDLSYQIIQQFRLIQQANSGDPLAQHELGLRLLLGDGIPADTLSAIMWIRKAAMQNLSAAQYNYGLILLNGIGVDWNPFEAYKIFRQAAIQNFPPAQFVVGILFTENLVVPRDWRQAYYWILKSKQNGYKADDDIIKLLEQKVPDSFKDSLNNKQILYIDESNNLLSTNEAKSDYSSQSIQESISLSFIDFDSEQKIENLTAEKDILKDLLYANLLNDSVSNEIKTVDDFINYYGLNNVFAFSNYDIPEILTLLGYLYREGKFVKKDELKALENFILAVRYDSPRATFLLLETLQNKFLINLLKSKLNENNNTVKFVWYGLARFGFLSEIILADAYKLLEESAADGYINSINELALNYYVGNYFNKDFDKAIDLWKKAERLGSMEATIRILLSKIFDESKQVDKSIFNSMINFEEKGSVLAQVALGYCYEKGRGTSINKALAVKYYRRAAQRGNRFAYERLKNLYDNIRPNSSEFRIN